MEIIQITSERLKIVLRCAVQRALHTRQYVQYLPEQCSFKDVLEISGLKESSLYETTKNISIPFDNSVVKIYRHGKRRKLKK